MGKDGQQVPYMDDAFVQTVSERYIELFEKITGQRFVPAETADIEGRILKAVEGYLKG